MPAWATAGAMAMVVWLLREIARRRDTRPLPRLVPAPRAEGTGAGTRPYDISSAVASLAVSAGVGVVGPGANAYMRALLVELLTTGTRVVIGRNELNRLFEGDFDRALQWAFAPQLHVSELLEDSIEHLELQQLMGEAAQANPDVVPACDREQPVTYWIATPGPDDDVVLPLLRRVPRLLGVIFGEWHHGPTCVIDATGALIGVHGHGNGPAIGAVAATLTRTQALGRLRAYASTAKAGR
ncbi:MAG: hypothetical protein JWL97_3674 [Gemmatimonadales bacterium]|nr:hypothetical protein [Gemmatimonadales bacterium]